MASAMFVSFCVIFVSMQHGQQVLGVSGAIMWLSFMEMQLSCFLSANITHMKPAFCCGILLQHTSNKIWCLHRVKIIVTDSHNAAAVTMLNPS